MENIENKFLNIFKNPSFPNLLYLSDGIICTEDGCRFPIHRSILAMKSQYFHVLFTGVGSGKTEFVIPAISGGCLCDILSYLYSGDILVTDLNIADLLNGAKFLLLKDMYMKVKQNVKACMTKYNCLKITCAACLIDDQDIMQECIRFIIPRFERIIADHQTELDDLPVNILYEILSNHSLHVFNENTVWKVIVQWTQKNTHDRLSYVPQLLFSLAIKQVNEKLATEILHHEIIWNNPYMAELKHMNSSNNFSSNRDVLLQCIKKYSCDIISMCYRRIPEKLFAITVHDEFRRPPNLRPNTDLKNCLCITYDENIDLWCKILEVDFHITFMTVIKHDIYIFGNMESIWVKFNPIAMDWAPIESPFRAGAERFIVAIETSIYVIDSHPEVADLYDFNIYDTEVNTWFGGEPLHGMFVSGVVAIDNGIFLVGCDDHCDEMIMKRFDVDTWEWNMLPPPNRMYDDCIALVAYHKKVYLVGTELGIHLDQTSSAQEFNTETVIWRDLPDFPCKCNRFGAVVLGDNLFVYGSYRKRNVIARWNELNEIWIKVENSNVGIDHFTSFFTIEDITLIRMMTKRYREGTAELEETGFSFNGM